MLLGNRAAEGLRVIGMCMVVLALSGFPSGRRSRFSVPMEAMVLLIAFGERGLSAYSPLGPATGALVMIVGGGIAPGDAGATAAPDAGGGAMTPDRLARARAGLAAASG